MWWTVPTATRPSDPPGAHNTSIGPQAARYGRNSKLSTMKDNLRVKVSGEVTGDTIKVASLTLQ
jgi:hypothetical protein